MAIERGMGSLSGLLFSRHDGYHVPGDCGTAPKPNNLLAAAPTDNHCYSKHCLLCLSGEVLNNIMGAVKGSDVLGRAGPPL